MSKKRVAKDSEASQVVVGGDNKKDRHIDKKPMLLVSAVVVLAAIGVGSWAVYHKLNTPKSHTDLSKSSKVPASAAKMTTINGKPLTAEQKSQQAIYYGEYDQGQQILKDQLGSAKTDSDKTTIYMQLATNALNAKKYDDANSYAQQVLSIKKTVAAYSLLAAIAAQQGDKAKAISYANQEKALLDTKSPAYQQDLQNIEDFIKGQQ